MGEIQGSKNEVKDNKSKTARKKVMIHFSVVE